MKAGLINLLKNCLVRYFIGNLVGDVGRAFICSSLDGFRGGCGAVDRGRCGVWLLSPVSVLLDTHIDSNLHLEKSELCRRSCSQPQRGDESRN